MSLWDNMVNKKYYLKGASAVVKPPKVSAETIRWLLLWVATSGMSVPAVWADGTPLLAVPNFARLNRVKVTPYEHYEEDQQQKSPLFRVWRKE
jgi:hypothetical protein